MQEKEMKAIIDKSEGGPVNFYENNLPEKKTENQVIGGPVFFEAEEAREGIAVSGGVIGGQVISSKENK